MMIMELPEEALHPEIITHVPILMDLIPEVEALPELILQQEEVIVRTQILTEHQQEVNPLQ